MPVIVFGYCFYRYFKILLPSENDLQYQAFSLLFINQKSILVRESYLNNLPFIGHFFQILSQRGNRINNFICEN